MSLHRELLRQARHLAVKEPKKPRQASLRRSVSASYYALFHLLIDEAVKRMFTGKDRAALRDTFARAFNHGKMQTVAKSYSEQNPSVAQHSALNGQSLPIQLVRVAGAFVNLQQARHDADYNRAYRLTRSETLDLLSVAQDAFEDWKAIRTTLPADVFLASLLVGNNPRGQR